MIDDYMVGSKITNIFPKTSVNRITVLFGCIVVFFYSYVHPDQQSLYSILTQGGGDRILLQPHTGFSQYYTVPCVVPDIVCRSFCQAGYPSESALKACEADVQSVVDQPSDVFDHAMEQLHEDIKQVLIQTHEPDCCIVTLPSAREAYAVANICGIGYCHALLGTTSVTLVLANTEQMSEDFYKGMELDSCLTGTLKNSFDQSNAASVSTISGYDTYSNQLKSKQKIEEEVAAVLEVCIKQKNTIAMLYYVQSTAIGNENISYSFCMKMKQQYGDKLLCIVDATQARCADGAISRYMHDGCIVVFEGSTFFAAPPFAGAVLIPATIAGRIESGLSQLSNSSLMHIFSQLSAAHCDKKLTQLRNYCDATYKNYGLYSRWLIALYEMKRFFGFDAQRRNACIQEWVDGIRALVLQQSNIFLLDIMDDAYADRIADTAIASVNSIVSVLLFGVDWSGCGVGYTNEILAACKKYLFVDMRQYLPVYAFEEEADIVEQRILLADPIGITPDCAVMRIALSAPIISAILECEDQSQALNDVLQNDALVLAKLSILAHYYFEFEKNDVVNKIRI